MGEQDKAAALVKRFGVAPIINAGGPNTLHAGSRPRDVVLAAMVEAAGLFFRMDELVIRAGEMIAAAVGAEAATVTAGAGSGLTLQAAAAITRGDPEKIARLPDTHGLANELIIQRRHRFVYDHLYLTPGARFVEVGDATGCDPDTLEAAITDRTVGVIHLETSFKQGGSVPLPTLAEIAHRHDLPVLCDAASRLPPRANLTKFLDEGADLVSFSGGKAVRGPQSTGILLGTKEWVEWARLNNAPNATVGRAMKVSREEIVGLVAAVEAFVAVDEAAEMAQYREQMQMVVDRIADIPGLRAVVEHNFDHVLPHAVAYLTPAWRGPSRETIHARLLAGTPRIYVSIFGDADVIYVDPLNIQPGELEIVAQRFEEELRAAAAEG